MIVLVLLECFAVLFLFLSAAALTIPVIVGRPFSEGFSAAAALFVSAFALMFGLEVGCDSYKVSSGTETVFSLAAPETEKSILIEENLSGSYAALAKLVKDADGQLWLITKRDPRSLTKLEILLESWLPVDFSGEKRFDITDARSEGADRIALEIGTELELPVRCGVCTIARTQTRLIRSAARSISSVF